MVVRPLLNQTIVVTRPTGTGESLLQRLHNAGADIVQLPVMAIEPADNVSPPGTIADVVIFISGNAVQYGLPVLGGASKLSAAQNTGTQLFAIGSATARALTAQQLHATISEDEHFTSASLLDNPLLQNVAGKSVQIVRGIGGLSLLGDKLVERGAAVEYVQVYERLPAIYSGSEPITQLLSRANLVTVASGQSLELLRQLLHSHGPQEFATLWPTLKLVVPSDRVLQTALQSGVIDTPVLAKNATDTEMFAAILKASNEQPKRRSRHAKNTATAVAHKETENLLMSDDRSTDTSAKKSPPPADKKAAPSNNSPASKRQPAEKAVSTEATSGGKGALIIAILSLLLALIALAFAGWLWFQGQQKEVQAQGILNQSGSKVETLAGELNRSRDAVLSQQQTLGALQQELGKVNGRVEGLNSQMSNTAGVIDLVNQANANVATFETRLNQAETGLTELRKLSEGGRNAWRRAEIEYLLTVATQRVQVYRDPETAISALLAADARMQELGDPALVDVRQQVRNAVQDLQAVEQPDIEGLALQLATSAESVAQLPLPDHNPGQAHFENTVENGPETATADADGASEAKADPAWKRFASSVGKELRSLVVVRHNGEPVEPMLPPEAEFFLRGNLRLQIDAARAALLNRDTANFQASLKTARGWLSNFDTGAAAVQALNKELARLESVETQPKLPDVSNALRTLRGFQSKG